MFSVIFTNAHHVTMGLFLSVTSPSFVETTERIGLVFGMGASFDLSYTVL